MSERRTVTGAAVVHEVVGDAVVGESIVNPNNPDDVMGYREACVKTRCGSLYPCAGDKRPRKVTCKRCLRSKT